MEAKEGVLLLGGFCGLGGRGGRLRCGHVVPAFTADAVLHGLLLALRALDERRFRLLLGLAGEQDDQEDESETSHADEQPEQPPWREVSREHGQNLVCADRFARDGHALAVDLVVPLGASGRTRLGGHLGAGVHARRQLAALLVFAELVDLRSDLLGGLAGLELLLAWAVERRDDVLGFAVGDHLQKLGLAVLELLAPVDVAASASAASAGLDGFPLALLEALRQLVVGDRRRVAAPLAGTGLRLVDDESQRECAQND